MVAIQQSRPAEADLLPCARTRKIPDLTMVEQPVVSFPAHCGRLARRVLNHVLHNADSQHRLRYFGLLWRFEAQFSKCLSQRVDIRNPPSGSLALSGRTSADKPPTRIR